MPILITNEPTSQNGGIQRYVSRLASTWKKQGERTIVIEPKSDVRAGRPWRTREVAMLRALAAYLAEIVRNGPEPTVASIWFPSGIVAALVPRVFRGPLVILAHGSEICPSKSGARLHLMRWTFRAADLAIANSASTLALLREARICTNATVVHCGVDYRPLARKSPHPPVILSVGRLIARKGFDRVIDAMPSILSAVPDARYRLVGEGPLLSDLKARAARLGVTSHVDFVGAIGDAEVVQEYESASCFAMPTRRIADDIEGFGIVYLEAAMASVPSIGGTQCGAEDFIIDGVTGRLVDGNIVENIARAIIGYLLNPAIAQIQGDAARELAILKFSWDKNANSIMALIQEITK